MTADKPEAGRPCAVWCGKDCGGERVCEFDPNSHESPCVSSDGVAQKCWCSTDCQKLLRPLNPAPRPVEQVDDGGCHCSDFNSAGMPCQPGTCPNRLKPRHVERATMHCLTCGGPCDGPCEEGDEQFRQSQPSPIGRCSCEILAKLREAGWSVAVHNDYRLGGVAHTFWLFTHADGRWAKGEGATDFEALRDIARRALALGGEEI